MRKSMSSFEDLKTSSQGANLTQSARTVDWSNNVYGDDFCDCDPVQTQLLSWQEETTLNTGTRTQT